MNIFRQKKAFSRLCGYTNIKYNTIIKTLVYFEIIKTKLVHYTHIGNMYIKILI